MGVLGVPERPGGAEAVQRRRPGHRRSDHRRDRGDHRGRTPDPDHPARGGRRRSAPGGAAGLHQPAAAGPGPHLPLRGQPGRHPGQVPRAGCRAVRGRLPDPPGQPPARSPVLAGPRDHRAVHPGHPGRRVRRCRPGLPQRAARLRRRPALREHEQPDRHPGHPDPVDGQPAERDLRDQPLRQGQDRHPADRQHLRELLPDLPGVVAPERRRAPVLGQCLSGAASTAARSVACVRSANGTIGVS